MRVGGPSAVRRIAQVALLALVLVVLGAANYRMASQFPGGNDFLPRWVGARAWLERGQSPYDLQVTQQAQRLIYGRLADPRAGEDVAHFAYPLPAMLFFGPIGLLPYEQARAAWMTVIEVSLALIAILGMALAHWRPRLWLQAALVLFAVLSYHGLRTIILGQFAAVEALLMAGALLAIQRRQDPLAGILLGLSIAKPQMTILLIPFVLLWAVRAGRLSVAGWLLATAAGLTGLSLALIPDWPLQWLRQLLDYPSYTVVGPPVSVIAGAFPNRQSVLTVVMAFLLLGYLIWEWLQRGIREDRWFQWTAAMTITVTNLIALRTATTNFVALFPALYLVFAVWHERWGGRGSLGVLLAVVVLFLGLWGLFLATVDGNRESPLMYLPLPLLSLAGLWWARWWVVRQLRL